MTVDTAKCPNCGTRISGDDIEILEIGSSRIAPMGMGKDDPDGLHVCPSCDVILG